jgi:hypothetical protein
MKKTLVAFAFGALAGAHTEAPTFDEPYLQQRSRTSVAR